MILLNFIKNNRIDFKEYSKHLLSLDFQSVDVQTNHDGKITGYGSLLTESHIVSSLIHSYKLKNDTEYRKKKNSARFTRLASNLIKSNSCLNNLETINKLIGIVYDSIILKRAKKSTTLDLREKELKFLDNNKILKLLNKKHGCIIYSSGFYQLTTTEGWSGECRGLVSEDQVRSLLKNNVIEQTPYFNHKGRKMFELSSKSKGLKQKKLPSWMKTLPTSYLLSCGAMR